MDQIILDPVPVRGVIAQEGAVLLHIGHNILLELTEYQVGIVCGVRVGITRIFLPLEVPGKVELLVVWIIEGAVGKHIHGGGLAAVGVLGGPDEGGQVVHLDRPVIPPVTVHLGLLGRVRISDVGAVMEDGILELIPVVPQLFGPGGGVIVILIFQLYIVILRPPNRSDKFIPEILPGLEFLALIGPHRDAQVLGGVVPGGGHGARSVVVVVNRLQLIDLGIPGYSRSLPRCLHRSDDILHSRHGIRQASKGNTGGAIVPPIILLGIGGVRRAPDDIVLDGIPGGVSRLHRPDKGNGEGPVIRESGTAGIGTDMRHGLQLGQGQKADGVDLSILIQVGPLGCRHQLVPAPGLAGSQGRAVLMEVAPLDRDGVRRRRRPQGRGGNGGV